jgi:hypothetical protein
VRFTETVASIRGVDPVGVILRAVADDLAGNHAPAGYHIEHRHLFRHTDGVIVQRQRVANNGDLHSFVFRARHAAIRLGDGMLP